MKKMACLQVDGKIPPKPRMEPQCYSGPLPRGKRIVPRPPKEGKAEIKGGAFGRSLGAHGEICDTLWKRVRLFKQEGAFAAQQKVADKWKRLNRDSDMVESNVPSIPGLGAAVRDALTRWFKNQGRA